MSEFRRYRRNNIAEVRDYVPGEDMAGVSLSDADKLAGSPKAGDKIARSPDNHGDRWLISAGYFAGNFDPVPIENGSFSHKRGR